MDSDFFNLWVRKSHLIKRNCNLKKLNFKGVHIDKHAILEVCKNIAI